MSMASLRGLQLEFVRVLLTPLKATGSIDLLLLSPLTLAEYEQAVRIAAKRTGLTALKISPHCARHAGASTAALKLLLDPANTRALPGVCCQTQMDTAHNGVQHHWSTRVAALMHRYPRYSRHRTGKLPRFHLCARLETAHSWSHVWFSIAAKLGLAGRRRVGAFLLVVLCSYAQPSELLPLRKPTSSVTISWSLLIEPREDGQRTEANLTDVSILLDWKWCHWINNVVSILRPEDKEARVFPFSHHQFRTYF